MQPRVGPLLPKDGQRRAGRGGGDGVAAQGGGRPDVGIGRAEPLFADERHDVFPPPVHPDGVPAAQCLAVRHEVGHDTIVFLGPAVGESEAGDHLVEDEQHAVASGDLAQAGQKPVHRRQAAVQRLYDHGRQLVGVRGDEPLGSLQVVVGRNQHVRRHGVVDAGGRRLGGRKRAQLRGEEAGDAYIVGPVVGALELHDALPAGECAGEAEGVHRGLGARGAVAQLVDRRAQPHQLFGQREGRLRHIREIRAARRLCHHRLGHFGAGVPHERGPPSHREVEVRPAVAIPQAAPFAARDDAGQRIRQVELAVRAGGEDVQGALDGGVGHRFLGRDGREWSGMPATPRRRWPLPR